MSPQRTNPRESRPTLRHQQKPHMPDTTVCKQSFLACLSLRSQRSNNHGKVPKHCLCASKRSTPQCLPMMGPETEHCNFWLNCNPQRNACPPSSIHVRNPKMQRCCCLFPLKTHCYKPNSKLLKQRWFCCSPKNQVFNARKSCFTGLPIDKANSQLQQTTPKCTQLEVFHSCLNRISTLIVLSTLYNQRKTLLFQTKIHSHLVCRKNQQILTHQSLHCLIYIFSMTNTRSLLPSLRYSQYKSSCQKQNPALLQTIPIFLETTSQKNTLQRTKIKQKRKLQTPPDSPKTLCRCGVIGTRCWIFLNSKAFLCKVCSLSPQIGYGYHFCHRSY